MNIHFTNNDFIANTLFNLATQTVYIECVQWKKNTLQRSKHFYFFSDINDFFVQESMSIKIL